MKIAPALYTPPTETPIHRLVSSQTPQEQAITSASYFEVYAWVHIDDPRKVYVGSRAASSAVDYISSTDNEQFWLDLNAGLLKRVVLFRTDDPSEKSKQLTQNAEWFAQMFSSDHHGPEYVYHKNNAHKGDETLSAEAKKVIVDWVLYNTEGIVVDVGYGFNEIDATNRVMLIAERVESRDIPITTMTIEQLADTKQVQNRLAMYKPSHAKEIAASMVKDERDFYKLFDPIVVVYDGVEYVIHDGNHRREALILAKALGLTINDIPVQIINKDEFGDTPEEADRNLMLLGSALNKHVKATLASSPEDYQFWISTTVNDLNLDLSINADVERLRESLKSSYLRIGSFKTVPIMNRAIKNFKENWERGLKKDKITKNMVSYSKANLEGFRGLLESQGKAAIFSTMSGLTHGNVIGYIERRMTHLDKKNGVIILHYNSLNEYVDYMDEIELESLKTVIKHGGIKIEVIVMEPFVD